MKLNKEQYFKCLNSNNTTHLKDDLYMMKESDFKKLFINKNDELIYNNVYVFESSTRYNDLKSEEEFIIFQIL